MPALCGEPRNGATSRWNFAPGPSGSTLAGNEPEHAMVVRAGGVAGVGLGRIARRLGMAPPELCHRVQLSSVRRYLPARRGDRAPFPAEPRTAPSRAPAG